MTNDTELIHVYDSYKFSDGRIVAFLKSVGGKLASQTLLEDSKGRRWKVRQYYWTTGSADSYEKREKEEAQNIFQYLLEGIHHNDKPTQDTKLKRLQSA